MLSYKNDGRCIKRCEWFWCKTNNECLHWKLEQPKRVAAIRNEAIIIPNKKKKGKSKSNNSAFTKSKREKVYERDGNKCVCCSTTNNLTLDHIKPKALGGSDNIENLQTMCKRCNSVKGHMIISIENLWKIIFTKI